jgi:hypothetical protein
MTWKKKYLVGGLGLIIALALTIVSMGTRQWQVGDSPV